MNNINSHTFATLLQGDHDVMDSQDGFREDARYGRAATLYALVTLWDAVQDVGWNDHTSDWDWTIDVTTRNMGVIHCDGIALLFKGQDVRKEYRGDPNFTACIVDVSDLVLRVERVDEGGILDIPATEITCLHFECN